MTFKLVLSILLFSSSFTFSQEVPEIDFEEAASSLSIDLDRMPRNPGKVFIGGYFDLIKQANQKDLVTKFDKSIKPFLSKLAKGMNNNNGQLIKVRLYVDEFGVNYLPDNFFLPYGVGMDPVDAYSEFINTPAISEEIQTTARDASYYLWVSKKDGNISINWIPRELNVNLTRSAHKVAMMKVKSDTRVYNPLNAPYPNYLSRANYWMQIIKDYSAQLESSNKLSESQRLSKRFAALQLEHANLVQEYNRLSNKLANNNSFMQTAEIMLTLASGAKDINSTFSEGAGNVSYDPKLLQNKSNLLKSSLKAVKQNIERKSDEISEVDISLKKLTNGLM